MLSKEALKLYSTLECPFATRTLLTLVEANIPFQYIQFDLRKPNSLERKQKEKPSWFFELNPNGEVPIIVHEKESEGKKKRMVVYESLICDEYIADTFAPHLVPKDSYQKALMNLWTKYISEKVIPYYYKLLMNQKKEEQEAMSKALKENIIHLSKNGLTQCRESSGVGDDSKDAFFMGTTHFTLIDIALIPFIDRIVHVLQYFRNFVLFDQNELKNNVDLRRFYQWYQNCLNRPSYHSISRGIPEDQIPFDLEIVKALGMKNKESFNFEKFIISTYYEYANPGKTLPIPFL